MSLSVSTINSADTPDSTEPVKRKKLDRKKSSWVWNHFKTSDINTETDMVLCRKCNENEAYDGAGPTPLSYNLKSKHKI